ncbi:MAG: glycosyltransferase family 39 protein [Thermoflexales bacterium]|nr:glycosyltransferase family 39 protein [Thermoflexales bacterium]
MDELFTARLAEFPLHQIPREVAADLHPPLYFSLIRLWASVAGTSEFSLRWLSVFFSMLGISLLWKLGYRLGGSSVALLSAAALSISPLFVEFSRMARYYSAVLTLGLLSTFLLLKALESGRFPVWLSYGAVTAAMLYTFYPVVALVLAHGLALFLQSRPHSRWQWLITVSLAGLCFLPWAVVAIGQIPRAAEMTHADLATTLPGLLLSAAYPFYAFSVGETLFPWFPAALPAVSAILILAVLGYLRCDRSTEVLLSLLLLVPVLFTAFTITYISTGTPFLNAPVRSLFVLPYFLLLVVRGWHSLNRSLWRVGLGMLIGLAWILALRNMYTGQQYLNPNYIIPAREVAQQIAAQASPKDAVIGEWDSGFSYYYQRIPHLSVYLEAQPVEEALRFLTSSSPERVWLIIIGRDRTREATPVELIQWLKTNYRLVEEKGYVPQDSAYRAFKERMLRRPAYLYKLVVYRFERPPEGGP